MPRRAFLIAAVLVFSLACVHTAVSYTSAATTGEVELKVTDPLHGLVSFVASSRGSDAIRQGESRQALVVTNNLGKDIYNLKTTVLRYSPISARDYLSLGSPDPGFLRPGRQSFVTLGVGNDCPLGDVTLAVALDADFDGGSARVLADLSITVMPGELTLLSGADGFVTTWNGGGGPDGTVVLYRYKPADGQDGGWTEWQEFDGASPKGNLPGYYEYKAVFGRSESEVISRYVEPPASPDKSNVLGEDAPGENESKGGEERKAEDEIGK